MEHRKRQSKSSRKSSSRRPACNHHHHQRPLGAIIVSNYSPINSEQRNGGSAKLMPMKAFNFDSLGRNQYFNGPPAVKFNRRIVNVWELDKTPLYKSPMSSNRVVPSTYLLGGVNYSLALGQYLGNKFASNRLKFLKQSSGQKPPSDGEVIFGSARLLLKEASGWEKSRIQWLLDLERGPNMHCADPNPGGGECGDICCFPFVPMWSDE